MCGIVGILNFDGAPVDEGVLKHKTSVLSHRGPDGQGVWRDGPIGLGHRRLAIRDLSALGHQPMSDSSGRIVVTYNGEIYNDRELRAELEKDFGFRFHSSCDTEIIPAGYLAWGDELFSKLKGMFAIGLWDARRARLVLARDAIGIKPLVYSADDQSICFASEIKSVLAGSAKPTRLNAHNIHKFLALGYVGPAETTIDGIHQVPPGTIVSFENGAVSRNTFWKPRRNSHYRHLDEAIDAFIPVWDAVVSDHLISDVPIGMLQSGGIDSSLVSLAASRHQQLPLYTASFASATHDETAAAKLVAKNAGCIHKTVKIGDYSPAKTLLEVVKYTDGQLADESTIPLLLLTHELRRYAKVALSGDGGDEFFGGYSTYQASRAAGLMRGMPQNISNALGKGTYYLGGKDEGRLPKTALLSRFFLGLAAGPYAHTEWRRYLPQFMLDDLYSSNLRPFIDRSPMSEYRSLMDAASGETLLDRCLLADQQFHLPAGLLMKTDSMSMANSVEIRVPLLDQRIMEFSSQCSISLLTPLFGPSKTLLREALRFYRPPPEVLGAPKRGFNSPLASWLRGPLFDLCEATFENAPSILEPFLRPDGIRKLWRDHREHRCNNAYAIWPMLILAVWRSQSEGYDQILDAAR
jgi:asparagine synthase (glutamine-hydrolysing)